MKSMVYVVKFITCVIIYIIAGFFISCSVAYIGTSGGLKIIDLQPFSAAFGITLLTITTYVLRNITISKIYKYFIALYGLCLFCFGCYVAYTSKQIVFDASDSNSYRYDICVLAHFLISFHIISASVISLLYGKDVTLQQLLFFQNKREPTLPRDIAR